MPTDVGEPWDQDSLAIIKVVLDRYGLGTLADWAWERILAGDSDERIIQSLRETDEYKQRFPAMEQRRAAGLNAISEEEYLAYERSTTQIMVQAGLPPTFYDQPEDISQFLAQDISVSELSQRISDGYVAALQAPVEVRQELNRLYGAGPGALAAFFLDPDRALPAIQRAFASSEIAGASRRSGYGGLTREESERIAALGGSDEAVNAGFDSLVQGSELFTGLPGQGEGDVSRSEQLGAAFGNDAAAAEKIRRRAEKRVAQGEGAQSFALTQGGASGLGTDSQS